jgi:hypothetical protein
MSTHRSVERRRVRAPAALSRCRARTKRDPIVMEHTRAEEGDEKITTSDGQSEKRVGRFTVAVKTCGLDRFAPFEASWKRVLYQHL